jgi:hypothetical protein
MSTHANMVKMTVTSVGADPYTITLNAASSGFQSFADAYGANATVDILITQGTVWEVARDCTYTHSGTTVTRGTFEDSSTGSRITTFDNTAVVSVVYTADSGRRWDSAALTYAADTVTTANFTGVVGTMHGLDIDGMTAARDFVLPTTAAAGDRIGVFCTTDAPTTAAYVLQIKSGATGDLINGTDHSSTIWSALLIKGECLIFRCIDSAGPHWIVEYDGRIPQIARMSLITTDIATSSASAWTKTNMNSADYARGAILDVATNDTITWRRESYILVSGGWQSRAAATLTDNEQCGWSASYGGIPGVGTQIFSQVPNHPGTGGRTVATAGLSAGLIPAQSAIQHNFYAASTTDAGARALNTSTFLALQEVLK